MPDLDLAGAQVVVLGRSDIVGNPVAALLRKKHATVTQCHSRTPQEVMINAVCPGSSTPFIVCLYIGRELNKYSSSKTLMLWFRPLGSQNMSKANGSNQAPSLLTSGQTTSPVSLTITF